MSTRMYIEDLLEGAPEEAQENLRQFEVAASNFFFGPAEPTKRGCQCQCHGGDR